MRQVMTNVLDAVGLLAVAAGLGAGAAQFVGWFGLVVSGAVVLGGVQLAEWIDERQADNERQSGGEQ